MNTDLFQWLATEQLSFDPAIPRNPADPLEVFAYCCEIRDPGRVDPLVVRFDAESRKYFIVCEGTVYRNEGILFEAGRTIGLSALPCQLIDDERPKVGTQAEATWPAAWPSSHMASYGPRLDALFRDLCQAIGRMVRSVHGQANVAALRVTDEDDCAQEVLLALWRELTEQDKPRLTQPSAVRRYIFGIIHNQAARASKMANRTSSLPEDWADSTRCIPDAVIAAAENHRHEKAADNLQAIIETANWALRCILSDLPTREAAAARKWLDGGGYVGSGRSEGLTLAQMRRVVRQLQNGTLASLLDMVKEKLRTIYRACPAAAARIELGRLKRLLAI